jgi:hypothetical protein
MDNETANPAETTTLTAPIPVAAANPAPAGQASDKPQLGTQASAYGDEVKAQLLVPGGDVIGRGIRIRPRQPYELKERLFDQEPRPTSLYYSRANDKTYIVPHGCEINGSPPLPANQSAAETLIEESWDRFSNQLTFNVSASVNAPQVTIDPSALHATNLKSEENSYYAMRNAFVPLFSIYLPSVPSSIEPLDKAAPAEPFDTETLEQARQKRDEYNMLFDRFGTHYVKSAWVGGKASLVFIVSKSSNLTEQEIKIGIQASVGGIGHGQVSSDQKHIIEALKNNSSCRVFGNGGDKIQLAQLSKLDESAYNKWLESVRVSPEVIQLEVAGIWTLVKNPIAAEALKRAYIEESSFVPLKAIVPMGDSFYFLDRDGYVFKYNPRPASGKHRAEDSPPVDPDVLQAALSQNPALVGLKLTDFEQSQIASPASSALRQLLERNQQLEKYLPILMSDPQYFPFTYPDSAISLSGFGSGLDNTIDLFEEGRCLRLDWRTSRVVPGYPMAISKAWPGVDFDRIDATIAVAPANRIYFFRGGEYIRVEYDGRRVIGNSGRNSIERHWPGVIFERIDTAIYFGNSKVYFFARDEYTRYDLALGRSDPGYPRYLNSNYVDDWELFE